MAADAEGDSQEAGAPLPADEARLAAACAVFVDAAHRFQDRMGEVCPVLPGSSTCQLARIYCPRPLAVLPCRFAAGAQDYGDLCNGYFCCSAF